MLYYSTITNKLYETEDALHKSEAAAKEAAAKEAEEKLKKKQEELKKKEIKEAKAREVEVAFEKAREAGNAAQKALQDFINEYGSFSTFKSYNSNKTPNPSDLLDIVTSFLK